MLQGCLGDRDVELNQWWLPAPLCWRSWKQFKMAYHWPAATRCISPVWGAKLLSRSRTISYQKSVCTISHLPPLWQTPLCSKAILVKQSMDTLSSAKPYLPARRARDLYVVVVIRDVLCASVCVARWGLGDSMNKQKADNLSDVTPWPHFIFRTAFFFFFVFTVTGKSSETLPWDAACVI